MTSSKRCATKGLPNEMIVAVSGYGQPEDRQRSREAGFDDHLVKPVHQDALIGRAAANRADGKRLRRDFDRCQLAAH